MISTRFLSPEEHYKFGPWLKGLNEEDRRMYFGATVSDQYIDTVLEKILETPERHEFLISYNCTGWLGVLHIARDTSQSIEFGVSVFEEYRNLGIGNDLLKEGIIWARNRGYKRLYLHCVRWNHAMAHLANKHGLEMTHESNDINVSAELPSASWLSLHQETADVNRRIFHLWLNRAFFNFEESCA